MEAPDLLPDNAARLAAVSPGTRVVVVDAATGLPTVTEVEAVHGNQVRLGVTVTTPIRIGDPLVPAVVVDPPDPDLHRHLAASPGPWGPLAEAALAVHDAAHAHRARTVGRITEAATALGVPEEVARRRAYPPADTPGGTGAMLDVWLRRTGRSFLPDPFPDEAVEDVARIFAVFWSLPHLSRFEWAPGAADSTNEDLRAVAVASEKLATAGTHLLHAARRPDGTWEAFGLNPFRVDEVVRVNLNADGTPRPRPVPVAPDENWDRWRTVWSSPFRRFWSPVAAHR